MKNRFVGVALGCLLSVSFSAAGLCDESNASDKKNEEILKQVDAALLKNPENQNLLFAHAQLLSRLNLFEKLTSDGAILVKKYPQSKDAYIFLAQGYSGQGKYGNCLTTLEKAFSLEKPTLLQSIMLANCYRNLHRNKEAIAILDKVIATDSTLAEAFECRGLCYYGIEGVSQRSLADLERALRLDPDNIAVKALITKYRLDMTRKSNAPSRSNR